MGKLDGKRAAQSGSQTWILLKDDGVYGDFPHARVECSDLEAAKQLYQVGERNNFGECFSGLITEEEALRRFKPGAAAAGTYDATHQTKDGAFHYADWTKSLREHIIEPDEFGHSTLYVKQGDKRYSVFATNHQYTPDQMLSAISSTEFDAVRFQDPDAVLKDLTKKLQDKTASVEWDDDDMYIITDKTDRKIYFTDFDSYSNADCFSCGRVSVCLNEVGADTWKAFEEASYQRYAECKDESKEKTQSDRPLPDVPTDDAEPINHTGLPF
jgi:hypothetical protein